MKIALRFLSGALYMLGFFGAYWIVSLALDREPPIVYEEARTLSPNVLPGGTLEVEFQVFRRRICDSDTTRWVTDSAGERHSIPSFTVGLRLLAGREEYSRSVVIPEIVASGPAYYQVRTDYFCNVFHKLFYPIEVTSPPIAFIID